MWYCISIVFMLKNKEKQVAKNKLLLIMCGIAPVVSFETRRILFISSPTIIRYVIIFYNWNWICLYKR